MAPRTLRIYLELFPASARQVTAPSRHEGGRGLSEDKISVCLSSSSGHDPLAEVQGGLGARWRSRCKFSQGVVRAAVGRMGSLQRRNQDTERKGLTLEGLQGEG